MKVFYGLFGHGQFHPVTGQALNYSFVELRAATHDDAEAQMFEGFGPSWSRVVAELPALRVPTAASLETWEGTMLSAMDHPFGAPLTPITFPAPVGVVAGETVTLRVRITEEAAGRTALWVAGRCLAERPAPGCAVLHGAGVWFVNNVCPKDWSSKNTPALLGAGEVLDVRYVPRDRAERAAKEDPENVSIVEGSTSHAHLGRFPDSARPDVTGLFELDALSALGSVNDAYQALCKDAYAAAAATEDVASWRDIAVGIEVHKGRVVGVRMRSR